MNDFLNSIGYGSWILPALLIIPVVGALAIWATGWRASAKNETTATRDFVVVALCAKP